MTQFMPFKKLNCVLVKIAVILFLSSFIPSCKSSSELHPNYFRYNQLGGLESLDPAFAKNLSIMWGVKFIYNTLFELDENMKVIPSLVDSYEVSNDGLVYTFYLRKNIYFHDNELFDNGKGRIMISDDVIYSFERIIDPKVASSGSWIFNGRLVEGKPFEKIDDFCLKIYLKEPFAPFLEILTMPYCSIVPKEVVEHFGTDFRNHPCGTGPFQFVHWEEGNSLILKKNENYWEKDENGDSLPYLDGIQVSFNEARSIELLLMLQGKIDFINGVDGTVKDLLLNKNGELKSNMSDKIALSKSTYLNSEFLGILMHGEHADSFLSIKKIRKAIDIGIDKKKLVTYYRNGVGVPAYAGFTPKNLLGYEADTFSSSLNKSLARKYVNEVKDSLRISTISITLNTVEVMSDMCNFIANELKEIGIDVKIQIFQASMLRQMMSQNQLPFFKAQWIADYPDAETYMAYFYSKFPSPPNYTRTNIPLYDKLYLQSLKETNDSTRLSLYRLMDSIIYDELPAIPLFYDEMLHFLQFNIEGFRANSLNIIDLKRVRKKPF